MNDDSKEHLVLQMAALLGRDVEGSDVLRLARRDAEDANLPIEAETSPPNAPDARLRHPLSGSLLDPSSHEGQDRTQLARSDDERAKNVATNAPDVTDVNKVWMALARDVSARKTPASKVLPDYSVVAHRSLTAALVGARRTKGRAALLYLHVGPVQSFVETSRRTHELFVSSYCVAYLTMQAIKAIVATEGLPAIVVPWLADIPLALKEWGVATNGTDIPELRSSLPNKVLAIVPFDKAQEIANKAADAVRHAWKCMANTVRGELKKISPEANWADQWDEQVEAHLELDTIVQPWPSTRTRVAELLKKAGTYDAFKEILGEVEGQEKPAEDCTGAAMGALYDLTHRVMAAHRKTYGGEATKGDHRPKCALCAQREQMGPIATNPEDQEHTTREFFAKLHENVASADKAGGRFQLTDGEGLCAVCLTKRFALQCYFRKNLDDKPIQYPNVPGIAAAPFRWWVSRSSKEGVPAKAKELTDTIEKIDRKTLEHPGNWLPGLGALGFGDAWLSLDGQWLYDSGYNPKVAWSNFYHGDPTSRDNEDDYKRLQANLGKPRRLLSKLCGMVDAKPSSYYAVLMLDGDDMGKWLTGRNEQLPTLGDINRALPGKLAKMRRPLGPAMQGELSQRIGGLALALYDIVENNHLGRIVYSGGDDLLAFLPLATVLPCLQAIRECARKNDQLGDRFTLSAGIAIHHMRNPLREALRHAREAEKTSKKTKDRFTVKIALRSGSEWDFGLPFQTESKVLVIPALMDMLPWQGQDDRAEHPLRSLNVAHRLDEEARVLGELDDVKPFRSRLRKLLGAKFVESSPLLADATGLTVRETMNVLHFVRFLLREENGIETATLLGQLPGGKRR